MNIEKSVLISVQPKWCGLVANHIKTREIRKNKPQLQPPFKCYIYCTKAKQRFTHGGIVETLDDLFRMPNGKIKYGYSGELMCSDEPYCEDNFLNVKVIGEFVCDEIGTYEIEGFDKNNTLYQSIRRHIYDEEFEHALSFTEYSNDMEQDEIPEEGLLKQSCLTFEEIAEYIIGDKEFNFYTFYGWHISDLVIYNKPKELNEFVVERYPCLAKLKRPPQSWCYVEDVKGGVL